MNKGFTLIELVAVLVLVGVLATAATVSLLPVAEGLILVRQNATAMQKSRLAFARLTRELTTITNVTVGGGMLSNTSFWIRPDPPTPAPCLGAGLRAIL